jgi:phospholipid:diacylglycerol acyltransferase
LRYLLDSHIEKPDRTCAFRSWPSSISLLPRGGNCLWPRLVHLDNDSTTTQQGGGLWRSASPERIAGQHRNLSGSESLDFLADLLHSTGHAFSETRTRRLKEQFSDRVRLPSAPQTTVFCVYGTGLPSETAFWFRPDPRDEMWWTINPDATDENWDHPLLGRGAARSGVGLVDGDGTVPLISLGFPCRSTRRGFNRDVGRVVTFEVPHVQTSMMDLRGGSATADHVDIMGNYDVIHALLMVVTGNGGLVTDQMFSNIDQLVEQVEACEKDSVH